MPDSTGATKNAGASLAFFCGWPANIPVITGPVSGEQGLPQGAADFITLELRIATLCSG
jgi:hypothetical protein